MRANPLAPTDALTSPSCRLTPPLLRYVQDMRSNLGKLNRARYRMTEVLRKMDSFVDASDPDVDVPNSIHAYQSAERARKEFPDDKAMQVAALIHDFGKVLVEFGYPQWTIVGDTYAKYYFFTRAGTFRRGFM